MIEKNFPLKKILDIFSAHSRKGDLEELERQGSISKSKRFRSGAIVKRAGV